MRSADTTAEAERVQIELLRQAGPTKRAAQALSLSAAVRGLSRPSNRKKPPERIEGREIDVLCVRYWYDPGLAADFEVWLAERNRTRRG